MGPVGSNRRGRVDPDVQAIFNAFVTPPTDERKILINNLVLSLKSLGVWSPIEVLHVKAAADSQAACVNWKKPGTYTAIPVNSPIFTADRGFRGDGATSYVNSGFNPATEINFLQNSASAGVWCTSAGNSAPSSAVDLSSFNGSNGTVLRVYNSSPANAINVRLNSNTSNNNISAAITTAAGFTTMSRSNSTNQDVYRDGVFRGTALLTSTPVISSPIAYGCLSTNGTPSSFSDRQYAAGFMGGALSAQNQADLYAALAAYMTAVGVV